MRREKSMSKNSSVETNVAEKTKKSSKKSSGSELHSGHRQRMMKKYIENGMSIFEEHEILEIVLYFLFSRCNTNDIAHELLNKFGSITKVFEAAAEELMEVKGIGKTTAYQIVFLGDFFRYLSSCTPDPVKLKTFPEISKYCLSMYTNETKEHCYILFLDKRYRLISKLKLASGTSSSAEISIADIIRNAVRISAAKSILVHNHPDSVASASVEDIFATRELAAALKNINVDLMDHIIVSKDSIYSINSHANCKEIFDR